MNKDLQKLFEVFYNDITWPTPGVYYGKTDALLALMIKHNIKSIFDAGCGPRHWMADNKFLEHGIVYLGGDIVSSNVKYCNRNWPELDINTHDMTTDPFPDVDLIFSSDVVIHLNNSDKLKFLKNFLNSRANYLLITHSGNYPYLTKNIDFEYDDNFPFQEVNWYIEPWNFPKELDTLIDPKSELQKRMCLWHRSQLESIIV